jgi:hypothetical protein
MNPFHVALIAGGMVFIAFMIGMNLVIWEVPSADDNSKHTLRKQSLIYTGGDSFIKDESKIN